MKQIPPTCFIWGAISGFHGLGELTNVNKNFFIVRHRFVDIFYSACVQIQHVSAYADEMFQK